MDFTDLAAEDLRLAAKKAERHMLLLAKNIADDTLAGRTVSSSLLEDYERACVADSDATRALVEAVL